MDVNDPDPLDAQLREYFEAGFAAQLGRSEQAIRAAGDSLPPARRRRIGLSVGALSAAAVLCFALFRASSLSKVLPETHRMPVAIDAPRSEPPPPSNADEVHYASYSRTLDDGVVHFAGDPTPVRRLRLQQVRQMSWIDADGKSRMEVTVPNEHVVFVECTNY